MTEQSSRADDGRGTLGVSHSILGVVIFILSEVMLFGGLISAFVIAEAGADPGTWPPPDQPRLPAAETLINSVALLLSGVALFVGVRRATHRDDDEGSRTYIVGALLLGLFFVAFQGWEWVALIREGLTLTSSRLGSFFYLIVGAHGLHALGGLIALFVGTVRHWRGEISDDGLKAISLFWYFVVVLWPILYAEVYL